MKFIGNIEEFIELSELSFKDCTILDNPEPSSLTILWFGSGDNEFIIDGKTHSFKQNQIVFLTEFHKTEVRKMGPTKFLRFNRPFYCVIDHDVEVGCSGLLFFGASQLPVIQIPEQDVEHFETLWKMFRIEIELIDNLQIGMLRMMLKRYLILCTRLFKAQHQHPKQVEDSNLIREFNFLVEQHFKTKHSVAEYADLMHRSPKTISNIFSKVGHKTPRQYIHERIMLEARRLLHYSDLQIKEIAYELGYNDLQTFSRFFRKQEGLSPSEFKASRAAI